MTVPPLGIREGDFEHIEAAVRETERGRWFLDEYARRVRLAEASRVSIAVERLEERSIAQQSAAEDLRRHVQRMIALLIWLVDHLNATEAAAGADDHQRSPATGQAASEAGVAALADIDALSVADKLKLFR